jgi:hypothetical protein
MDTIVNSLNNIALALIAIAPTVFIFSVTLLGTAIENSEQEEKKARDNDKKNLKNEIDDIEKSINSARKNGDTKSLTNQLETLKAKQAKSEANINDIKVKYQRINLNNSVLYPCVALLLVFLANVLIVIFKNQPLFVKLLLILSDILLVLYGMIKIYRSLELVQKISANTKESEKYSKLKDIIRLALDEHDEQIQQANSEEVSLKFIDKAFPLNTTPNTDLEIKFHVKLERGNIIDNVDAWFFIADGFELLNPTKFWKQNSNYDLPNVRTVKIPIGKLNKDLVSPGTLKLKTPTNPGKYILRYKVYGDGFAGSQNDLSILVG